MKDLLSLRHSLRNKLLAVILFTTLSALFVAGGIILAYDINAYRTNTVNDMTTQLNLLAVSSAVALQFDDADVAYENLNLLKARPSVQAAALYNEQGALFAWYARADSQELFPDIPHDQGAFIADGQLEIYRRIIDNGAIVGTAYLRADYELNERIRNFLGILGLVTLGAMLIAAALSLWLQSVISRPILSIVDIARRVVSDKDYTQRARKLSEDEVGILVDAFNEMLDEIRDQTRALESSNRRLEQESAERKRAREEVLKLNRELEVKVLERTRQLRASNQELESFCYSVSHDLRAPLRSISGFSQALVEDVGDDIPEESRRYLDRIIASTLRMGQLIEDLLNLSRVSRGDIARQEVDFSAMANDVIRDLQGRFPDYEVDASVWEGIKVNGDPKLLRIVLENLLNNAWKFTSKQSHPRVEVGAMVDGQREVYYVRDNGAGFDMAYADKLFGAFQRLHAMNEYPGTGIGLATVQRIIHRHGGRIWFQSSPGNGAVFYFTLKPEGRPSRRGDPPDPAGKAGPRLRSV